MPTRVQMAKDSPAETNLLEQLAVDPGETVLLGINQKRSLHAGEHLFYTGRRSVARVGTEFQAHQFIAGLAQAFLANLGSIWLVKKRIRQCLHDSRSAI